MKNVLGLRPARSKASLGRAGGFVAVAVAALMGYACSSSGGTSGPTTDGGSGADGSTPPGADGGTPPGAECVPVMGQTCPNGAAIQACVENRGAPNCTEYYYAAGGQKVPCMACGNCTSAAAQLTSACGGGTGGGSGGGGGGAGGNVTVACDEVTKKGECYISSVPASVAPMTSQGCTMEGGNPGSSCPAASLIGCCRVGASLEICYYPSSSSAATAQADCGKVQGTWSTTP
jgi:hypothetical protein